MRTEEQHLKYMCEVLPPQQRSLFIPVWRVAGWVLGWLPTIVGGERWLFVTVDAVETFVDEHY